MYASADDVLERWLGGNPPTEDVIDTFIFDAETLVNFEFPDLAAAVEAEDIPAGQVRFVVCQMVIRALSNPNNLRSTSEGIDSYSRTVTYAGDDPGSLWLTDQERVLLTNAGFSSQTAFTIDPTPIDADTGLPVAAWIGGSWPDLNW